jgi:hypothetical protein
LVPTVLPLEGTRRAAVGSTSVGGAAVYVGDFLRTPGAGAFVRVSQQLSETISLGGDVGFGVANASAAGTSTTYVAATGRFHGSWTPNSDNIAVHGGVSVAGGNGGGSLALDIGARFGVSPHERVDLWAGQSIGYTLAFFSFMSELRTTSAFTAATSIGAGFRVTPTVSVGPGLTMALWADSNGGHPNEAGGGFRPGFVPSIFVSSVTGR